MNQSEVTENRVSLRYTQSHVKHCMLAEGRGGEGGEVGRMEGWGGGGTLSGDGGRGVVLANDIEMSLP